MKRLKSERIVKVDEDRRWVFGVTIGDRNKANKEGYGHFFSHFIAPESYCTFELPDIKKFHRPGGSESKG